MTIEIIRQSVGELVHGLDQVVVIGDPGVFCVDALPLRDSRQGCVTLIDAPARAPMAVCSGAVAVVTAEPIEALGCTQIVAKDIHGVFTHIVSRFRPREEVPAYASIHSSAQIDPTATIGSGTRIDAGVVVGAGVVIGNDCHLMPGVVVMEQSAIGNCCRLFPNVVIYEHSRIDDHVRIHAGTIIGADGFGYRQVQGRHVSTAQLGYVHIESHVDIGANVTIDRGTYGVTRIGEGTKIDNLVMIAHNCHIGRHNLLCSQVGIAGSCQTGDYVVLAGQVGLADHITLGDHAIVGAQAGVMENLAGDQVYLGSPATSQRDQMQIMAVQRRLPEIRREVKTLRREMDAMRNAQTQEVRQSQSTGESVAQESQRSASADEHAEDHQRCIPFRRPAA
ncbi:MAG TPA: UDP-3-O-(3-hydroxymyristoyl)glucosamine N-acyltransferase [Planctomycetaceae bacterium]|nr:UDP-3-O-(3-hydroxymyristoyl)glucosamine N-acyltransferase [Planctomycetaceae bacterium]